MKTRWGTCYPSAKRIRINLELAKNPKEWARTFVLVKIILTYIIDSLIYPNRNRYRDRNRLFM
ncbi:MAG: M48 family metallopeptidase [Chlorobiaceae bacterium]|nr:M48 family metallopeptidase [Chlorobiaceae bacterium]